MSSFDIGGSTTDRGVTIGFDYEYNSVNRLVENDQQLQNDPRTRNGQSYLIRADYIHNSKWAFSAFLPWVIQSRATFSEDESADGLGDLTLISQYSYLTNKDAQIKISLGVKLPTGKQFIQDNRGINLSPDMQSGSGTVDFLGRVAWAKNHLFMPNLANQTALSYRYNNTNAHFGDPQKVNGRSFKFGNETILTSAFSYLSLIKTWFVIPDFGFQVRYATPNEEEKSEAPNSGGYWYRVPIGVQLQPNETFSIRIFTEVPVGENLNGLQITTNYKLGLQLRYRLKDGGVKE